MLKEGLNEPTGKRRILPLIGAAVKDSKTFYLMHSGGVNANRVNSM